MTGNAGWDSGEIARAARRALPEEMARRAVQAEAVAEAARAPALVGPVPVIELPSASPPAQALSFLQKLKVVGTLGPKAMVRVVGRKVFRLPVVGYALRTAWLAVRLPALARGIFDAQRANDVALQALWQAVGASAAATDDLSRTMQDLSHLIGGVERQARDADQILRRGLTELWRVADTKADAVEMKNAIVDLRRLLNEQARQRARAPELTATIGSAAAPPPSVSLLADDAMAAFYMAFEDKFRGPREQVKEWQRDHLPRVAAAVKATGGWILDVGCGRGEWLELLGETGFEARGVDLNDVAAGECRRLGLDVATGDALATLRALPADSLAVVSAFHVIEHLPLAVMFGFLDEALRALKPGGIIILETPNPGNLQVGAHKFWLDLTHIRPLPSETVAFMVESRGFAAVEVVPQHPIADAARHYGDPLLDRLNQLVHGAQDYAVIGRK